MRTCHFCGADNEDWMKICQECGNPVIDNSKKETNFNDDLSYQEEQPKLNNKGLVITLIILSTILVGLLIYTVVAVL